MNKIKLIPLTYNKLQEFRQKSGCWRTETVAFKLLAELKFLLLEKEYLVLSIAFSHFRMEGQTTELYHVCQELSNKYKVEKQN